MAENPYSYYLGIGEGNKKAAVSQTVATPEIEKALAQEKEKQQQKSGEGISISKSTSSDAPTKRKFSITQSMIAQMPGFNQGPSKVFSDQGQGPESTKTLKKSSDMHTNAKTNAYTAAVAPTSTTTTTVNNKAGSEEEKKSMVNALVRSYSQAEYDDTSPPKYTDEYQNSPERDYTPYDVRYGIPDDYSDDDLDDEASFRQYDSILQESSVLHDSSMTSVTPPDMKPPRGGMRKEIATKKQYQKVAGRRVNNIMQGSINSIVSRDNKLKGRIAEKQSILTTKKLAQAQEENRQLRVRMDKTGVLSEIDKLKAVITQQRQKIADIMEAKKALEKVIREQGRALTSNDKSYKAESNLWSHENQIKVLMERVRRLNSHNLEMRERDKTLNDEIILLDRKIVLMKNKIVEMGQYIQHLCATLDAAGIDDFGEGIGSLAITEDGSNNSPEEQKSKQGRARTSGSNKNDQLVAKVKKLENEREKALALLRSQNTRHEKEKSDANVFYERMKLENERLRNTLEQRDKEARLHILTVKKLATACEDLQKGNQSLQEASAIFKTKVDVIQPTSSIDVREQQPKGFGAPHPPSGSISSSMKQRSGSIGKKVTTKKSPRPNPSVQEQEGSVGYHSEGSSLTFITE